MDPGRKLKTMKKPNAFKRNYSSASRAANIQRTSDGSDIPQSTRPVTLHRSHGQRPDVPPTVNVACQADAEELESIPWSLLEKIESHEGLFTVSELATILRKSTCTVYRWAQRGNLPSLIIGGSRCFDPAALGMFFRQRAPESAAAVSFHESRKRRF